MTARGLWVLIAMVGAAAVLFGRLVLSGEATPAGRPDPWAFVPRRPVPLDHAAFFDGPLADGPAVTQACLRCHPAAAQEVMRTSHWTWAGEQATSPLTGESIAIGKRNLANNFCISLAGNWSRCTSCHVGYGWKDDTFFDTATPEQVDCLVCHDRSARYEKDPVGAGLPEEGADLLAAARSVGPTTRASCGVCHFKGGGGDGVKHGDLDETMYFPAPRVDVHMGRHGLVCADCHRTEQHRIRGRVLPPDTDEDTRVACADCHGEAPHAQDRLDAHVRTLACQTCHVPRFAVETGTKMWWDWSQAGLQGDAHALAERLVAQTRRSPEADDLPPPVRALFDAVGRDPDVWAHYDRKKGLFLIARRQVPEYRWYNRTTRRYLPGQPVEGRGPVAINETLGDAREEAARIWPFKVHRGRQPFDLEHRTLLYPRVHGPGGYWDAFDWERALADGAASSGVPYSGRRGWVLTEMLWPQNHMVQAKEHALRCDDCHGAGGRMDWTALGYAGDPALQGDRRQMDIVRGTESASRETGR